MFAFEPTRAAIHPSSAPEILRLRNEVEVLREENRQFRDQFGAAPNERFIIQCKAVLGLSRSRARLLSILLEGRARSHDGLLLAYFDGRGDLPNFGVIKTLVSNVRKALAPHGVTIEVAWGRGYFLYPAAIEKIRGLVGEGSAR